MGPRLRCGPKARLFLSRAKQDSASAGGRTRSVLKRGTVRHQRKPAFGDPLMARVM
jgi:hypothetical protein